jgi:hypothetical protein
VFCSCARWGNVFCAVLFVRAPAFSLCDIFPAEPAARMPALFNRPPPRLELTIQHEQHIPVHTHGSQHSFRGTRKQQW